jgi:hypothetical protein
VSIKVASLRRAVVKGMFSDIMQFVNAMRGEKNLRISTLAAPLIESKNRGSIRGYVTPASIEPYTKHFTNV